MRKGTTLAGLIGLATIFMGCAAESDYSLESDEIVTSDSTENDGVQALNDFSEVDSMCDNGFITMEAVDRMLELTDLTDREDPYTTFDRIDGIATLFEACGDPWGLFPTTYRLITNRGIEALENGEFESPEWGANIIVDFASRYMMNLRAVLQGEEPSWAWKHYYQLADNSNVSKTRSVIVAMAAHLMLDLPHSMVAIDTQEEHKQDFFVFGEKMIEVADDIIHDLKYFHNTDAEDILNGFFLGRWVDGIFGRQTTITLSYQTVRTKSWNNRWLLQQSWGELMARSEIYSSFWATDGVLATLDAAGTI